MPLTAQFIGLSKKAKEFISDKENPAEELQSEGKIDRFPSKDILLRTFLKKGIKYQEVVCAEVWSSGLMIFTCLENTKTKERLFEWVQDPFNKGQFCSSDGRCWF